MDFVSDHQIYKKDNKKSLMLYQGCKLQLCVNNKHDTKWLKCYSCNNNFNALMKNKNYFSKDNSNSSKFPLNNLSIFCSITSIG